MLRRLLLCFIFMSPICVGHIVQECRVMAQCGSNLQWKQWLQVIPGPSVQNGEHGWTETIHPGSPYPGSPEMHYLGQTTTWNAAKTYCQARGKNLCRSDELCISNDGGRQMIYDVLPGDFWVPVLDGQNKWMQAGDSRRFTCYTHTETHRGNVATWGNNNDAAPYKGYVYCCRKKFDEIRYQYIGKAATYVSSKKHCMGQGKRLCQSTEICTNNLPVYGVIARDAWVAVNDRENEWIQIGNARTCSIHSVTHSGYPSWGTRTDKSLRDFLGFVLCCPFH